MSRWLLVGFAVLEFRAITAYRARLAASRGYRYLQTDASKNSRPILERLGFARLGTTTPFIHA